MVNHPNRPVQGHDSANPSPERIREYRAQLGLTQKACGSICHTTTRVWQQWETEPGEPSHRAMHAASWELFRIKTGGLWTAKQTEQLLGGFGG